MNRQRINTVRQLFVFIAVAFLLCGCGKRAPRLSDWVTYVPAEFDSVIRINKWIALGPFAFDPLTGSPATSFDDDDLSRYGIAEGSQMDVAAIEALQAQGAGVFLLYETAHKVRLTEYIRDSIEYKSNVYLVAIVQSEKAQDVTLIIDGSRNYRGWCNGQEIIEVKTKYNTEKEGDKYINVSLQEGANTLFFKVNRGTNVISWDLLCAIVPRREAERLFCINFFWEFVVNPIVNDSVEVYAGPYLSGTVEILDLKNQTVARGFFENQDSNHNSFAVSGLHSLSDGFYKVALTVGGTRLEEIIYKGDYSRFVEDAYNSVASTNESGMHIEDLKAAMQLVKHFKEKPIDTQSPSEVRFYNNNRVLWGYSLYRMLHNEVPSIQIMTYRDANNFSGEFIFHAGDRHRPALPLLIVVPYRMEGSSFFEDWYTSNLDWIVTDNLLADQYGFAVACIYAGGTNYSSDFTEKEITAVISRLESEFDIDRNNIFIMGSCEGGRRALVQLALTPERYAACFVDAPITLSGGMDGIPISLIPQMGNTPVMIMHGRNDKEIPVVHSRRFAEESLKIGFPVEYVETEESHVKLHNDCRRLAFEFFSKIVQKNE